MSQPGLPGLVTPPRRAGFGVRQALAAPLLVAVVVQSAGNLVLHAITGRLLGPAAYGELGTLLAVLTFVTVPLLAVQAAASAAGALTGRARGDAAALGRIAAWSTGIAAVTAACAPLLAVAFQLTHWYDAALLGPFLGVSILLAVARGRLLGHRRIGVVAVSYVVGIGVRFAFTLLLVDPLGITGALLATLIGELAAFGWATTAVFRAPATGAAATGWLAGRELGRAAVALTGLFLFTTIDLFLARALLDPTVAGGYVAAATIGKALLALPSAALSAAYPRLVRAGTGPSRLPELRRTTIVVVGTAMAGGVVVAALPGPVLTVAFGTQYTDAAGLLAVLALVAAGSSIISVATYAHLAVASRWALLPWAGAVVQIAAIAVWHADALQLARAAAAALAITAGAALIPLLLPARRRARAPRTAEAAEPGTTRAGRPTAATGPAPAETLAGSGRA